MRMKASTHRKASSAIMGCGILVMIDQIAAPHTLIPLDTRTALTAKPSGTLCTASVVVIIMPSCVPDCVSHEGIVP